MDHMRISGTEPSSVIILQNKVVQKLKSDEKYSYTLRQRLYKYVWRKLISHASKY